MPIMIPLMLLMMNLMMIIMRMSLMRFLRKKMTWYKLMLKILKKTQKLKVIIIQVGSIRKCASALPSDFVNKQDLK